MGKAYLFKESEAARSLLDKLIKHKVRDGSLILLSEDEMNVFRNGDVQILEIPDPKE